MKRRWKILLFASVALNLFSAAVVVVWSSRNGGPEQLLERLGLVRTSYNPRPYHLSEIQRFRALPNTPGEIVFLGDSLMAEIPWAEYFSPIRNRGIGGDTSIDVLARLDEVYESKPAKVFIAVGTNDLSKYTDADEVVSNIERAIVRLREASPKTRVYVLGLLPVSTKLADAALMRHRNRLAPTLNARLGEMCARNGVPFIDLYDRFTDADGDLKHEFTHDGVHLTQAAHRQYAELLAPWVNGQ